MAATETARLIASLQGHPQAGALTPEAKPLLGRLLSGSPIDAYRGRDAIPGKGPSREFSGSAIETELISLIDQ